MRFLQFPRGSGMKLSFSALVIYLLILAGSASAQESRASIIGRVTDSSGGVVPGAKVTATHQGTNVAVRSVSNAEGNYQILFVNPGTYKVVAELAGFKMFQRDNIELQIG